MQNHVSIRSQPTTLARFKELGANLEYLSNLPEGGSCTLKIEFATPLSLLPLVSLIHQKKLQCNEGMTSYLHTVHFPDGEQKLEALCRGTYMPIVRLSLQGITDPDERSDKLDALHGGFLAVLRQNIKNPEFSAMVTSGTFGVLLGELIDNINEHSQAKNVYIFAQYWPTIDTCEVCLMDDGRGLYGSLVAAQREVKDSEDAIRKIVETGLSAKDEFGETHRGTGLRMTRKAITSADIKGEFLIGSGDAAYLETTSGSTLLKLSRTSLYGTMIMLRFEKPQRFPNIYQYV